MVTMAGSSPTASVDRWTRTGTGGSPGTTWSMRVTASESSGDAKESLEVIDVAQLLVRSVRPADPAAPAESGGPAGAGPG